MTRERPIKKFEIKRSEDLDFFFIGEFPANPYLIALKKQKVLFLLTGLTSQPFKKLKRLT
jgi:hypothetical protein